MYKKLITACMALAAFVAFVIAPMAQSAVLTENGTALAVGSSFTTKNEGVTRFTGGWGLGCEVVHLQGKVTKNSESTVAGEIPVGSATFTNAGGAACSSELGASTVKVTSKLCLSIAKGSHNLMVTGCAGAPITFDLTAAGIVCKYEASSFSASISTNVTPAPATLFDQLAVEEFPRQFFCPDEGKIDTTFRFYTTGGTTGLTFS